MASLPYDLVMTDTQQLLKVHHSSRCLRKAGEPCPIHAQSNHHMKMWPQRWNTTFCVMERVCTHGLGHLDPDDIYVRAGLVKHDYCDGCCKHHTNDTEEIISDAS